jgi:hypothetical protein
MSPRVLLLGCLAGACLLGQIGGPYPGGQYPPGGYPPGGYPPGTYPGDTGGIGLPIPGRSKKESKDKKSGPSINLSGKIAKQDGIKSTITLSTDDGRNIEFNLSGDTKITAESGKLTAGDLHIGDELTIHGHTDDKGFFYADTIRLDKSVEVNTVSEDKSTKPVSGADPEDRRPVLRRGDSPAKTDEAKAAPAPKPPSKPEDEYSTGEEHPILPDGGVKAANSGSDDPDRPILRRGAPKRQASEDAPERPVEVASAKPPAKDEAVFSTGNEVPTQMANIPTQGKRGDDFIEKAREAAAEFTEKLPNFVCQEFVARYQSETQKPNWQAQDVLSYDLVYENGKEDYKNLKINGKVVKAGADKDSGTWSTGEFGTILLDLFHPATATDFRLKGPSTISHRSAVAYTFTVDKDHSHWRIQGGTQWIMPAYKGTIWLDKETHRALRIEMQAVNLPAAFLFDHTESAADYDFVMIKDHKVLLPTHAEVLSCQRGTFYCSRNAIDFRNYHAYTGDTSITFGEAK